MSIPSYYKAFFQVDIEGEELNSIPQESEEKNIWIKNLKNLNFKVKSIYIFVLKINQIFFLFCMPSVD